MNWAPGEKAIHVTCQTKAVEPMIIPAIDIPCPKNRSYLPYQVEGIRFVHARFSQGHKGALIADEMGIGKTIQAIGLLNAFTDINRVLIVCPASLKLNWRSELAKWLVRTDMAQRLSTMMF